MSPKRIQMRRDRPWRCYAPDAVKIDRSTKWGNPFKVGGELPGMPGQKMDAEDACQCFELLTIPTLPIHELIGKDVACWCALDAPCHGDVLMKHAARLKPYPDNAGEGAS